MRLQSEWGTSLSLASVNADENFKLANQYRLQTLPTLLLFEKGQVVFRMDSFKGLELFQQDLGEMLTERLGAPLANVTAVLRT
jgi:thioredoxin 1